MSLESRKIFGARIRSLRLANEMTQEVLADKAGIHSTYLGSVERGARNISFDNILKIANALGVRPAKLFDGEDSPEGRQ